MKHIKLFEDGEGLPSMFDPLYSNPIFSIRYRQLNDLSNKKAPDTIEKPIRDILDGITEGDYVTGKGLHDDKEHSGMVLRVKEDTEGENIMIEIEEDGEVIELSPATVKFTEGGNKGNVARANIEPVDTGNSDYTLGGFNDITGAADNFGGNESLEIENTGLKNIKSFYSFNK